jgi:light-regulated signal transduction histidine kinase (bacteriophytochrome)
MHFPAPDIPVQARQLFLSNAVRSIADLAAPQAAIVPQIQPRTGRPSDLTHAFMRRVSRVRVEYLG